MKWYLASRTRHTKKMQDIAKLLMENGHEISSTWIYVDNNLKPFLENLKKVQEISIENVNQLLQTDIFVLINDLQGVDVFIEMGAVLGLKASGKDVKIYVVGDYDKTSFTQLHPSVIHVTNLQAVFDAEKINYENFTFPTFE